MLLGVGQATISPTHADRKVHMRWSAANIPEPHLIRKFTMAITLTSTTTRWAVSLALLFLFAGCNSILAKSKYKEIEVKNGGSINGTVKLSGKIPASEKMKITKDREICGDYIVSERLMVSLGGGISNAVVSLKGVAEGKKWNFPKSLQFDQKKCAFSPHVMVIRPKTEVTVTNSDSIKHNFHTISKGIFSINKMMSSGKSLTIKKRRLRKPGIVRVKCDLHEWMSGWWIVAKTPYTVLTGQDGEFVIKDVPSGEYDLSVWHEKLGETMTKVKVKPGAMTRIVISFPVKK